MKKNDSFKFIEDTNSEICKRTLELLYVCADSLLKKQIKRAIKIIKKTSKVK